MKSCNRFTLRPLLLVSVAGSLLMFATTAMATNHIITFTSFVYSDSSMLPVAVGDTITWQGNFSFHPLASTSVPGGANTFSNNVGTTFSYVVTVVGTYHYWCAVHGPTFGMTGSFVASPTGVGDQQSSKTPGAFHLYQNFPNPFNPTTTIPFAVARSSYVTLKIYNLLGEEVATLVSRRLAPGTYSAEWNAGATTSGIYLYRLQTPDFVQTKKLILLK